MEDCILMGGFQGHVWEAEILETSFLAQMLSDGAVKLHRLGLRLVDLVLDGDRPGCERAP